MTIANFKAQGVTGIRVWCVKDCPRMEAKVPWDKIGLPDDTPFPEIARRKRFVCEVCGRLGSIMPDWGGMQDRDRAERNARPWP